METEPIVQPPHEESIPPAPSKLWKFFSAFLMIVVLSYVGLLSLSKYERTKEAERIKADADAMERNEQDLMARMSADTYGGKTPEQTLTLYIKAVEKGDYDLASKYFVFERQDDELAKLQNASVIKGRIASYVDTLKKTLATKGTYADSKQFYSFSTPLVVNLTTYPSGLWKIQEI